MRWEVVGPLVELFNRTLEEAFEVVRIGMLSRTIIQGPHDAVDDLEDGLSVSFTRLLLGNGIAHNTEPRVGYKSAVCFGLL